METLHTGTPWLGPDDAHVWVVTLDQTAVAQSQSFTAVLSAQEWERALRFHAARDHLRFVTTRGVLRCLIARYTGMAARDVSFGYGQCGKPFLPEAGSCALRFNVSHSGGHSLLAFTTGRDIGVDVQRESSELSFMPIAERSFSAAEMASLLALKDSARVSAFFRGWVRKEAYVKGTGAGLSVPLNSFEVTADPDDPTLLSVVDEGLVGSRWRLMDLESVPGFASALAIDAPDVRISQNICNIHDFADEIGL